MECKMRIREARARDVVGIARLIGETYTESELRDIVMKKDPVVYVGTDFGANILGCAIGADKIYIAPTCIEPDAKESLAKMYE